MWAITLTTLEKVTWDRYVHVDLRTVSVCVIKKKMNTNIHTHTQTTDESHSSIVNSENNIFRIDKTLLFRQTVLGHAHVT